jgi:hypothetical protein
VEPRKLEQLTPEVDVLDWLLVDFPPTVLLPVVDPTLSKGGDEVIAVECSLTLLGSSRAFSVSMAALNC